MPLDLATLAAVEHDRAHRPLEAALPGIDPASVVARVMLRGEPHAWKRPATIGAALTNPIMQRLADSLNSSTRPLWDTLNEWRTSFLNGVRTFTPSETIAAEETIRAFLKIDIEERGGKLADPSIALGLRVRFFCHDRAARKDLDNLLKTLCESCSGSAVLDDKQIIEIQATKITGAEEPRTEVIVYRCGVFGR